MIDDTINATNSNEFFTGCIRNTDIRITLTKLVKSECYKLGFRNDSNKEIDSYSPQGQLKN